MSLGLFQPGPTGQSNIEIIPEVPGNLKRSGSRSFEGINLLMHEPSAKNLYPFRYSVMVSSAYPITPLISSNLALLYSPGPNALYIGPGFTFSLKQILDLDLIGQVFLSDTDTGYRSLVSVVFGRLKWSF